MAGRNNKAGFSLVEVLISSAILLTAIIAGFSVYLTSNKYVKVAKQKDSAYLLLSQEAENLMHMDFDYLSGLNHYRFVFDGTGPNQGQQGESVITSYYPSSLLNNSPYKKAHFDPNGIKGSIIVYISPVGGTNNTLLDLHIVLCYDSYGTVIGEDKDLDGRLDSGEDSDGDGILSSPFELDLSLSKIGT